MTGLGVGGLTPFSATDYPDRLAAVVFCQGCPWRCGYCHNPHLWPARRPASMTWEDVRGFLSRRRGLLDGVVFSGGEPTLQKGLLAAVREAGSLGFLVGLHTAGIYPERLGWLLPHLDWVGFDVKAPFARYEAVTGVKGSGLRARRSLERLLESGVACECRATVHPALHSREELLVLAGELATAGVRRFVVQEFRSVGCADRSLTAADPGIFFEVEFCRQLGRHFESFAVRRA